MTEAVAEFWIFFDLGEGSEPWQITCVEDLEDAKAIMLQFACKVPGRYFIWDSLNGIVVEQINSASP